jgi:hypothetical protein
MERRDGNGKMMGFKIENDAMCLPFLNFIFLSKVNLVSPMILAKTKYG